MKKKLLSLILVLILSLTLFCTAALAVVSQSAEYYVNDSAGVLSDGLKSDIISVNGELEYYCKGAQVVVVTVKYLDGMYSDEYAMQLHNDWRVGDSAENNGMLLLLATEENKAWLSVGAGISGSFTSETANEYLDNYFWDDFDNGDYNAAVVSLFPQLMLWYEDYYNTDFFSSVYDTSEPADEYSPDSFPNGGTQPSSSWGLGIFGIIGVILSFVFRNPIIIIIVIIIIFAIKSDKRKYTAYHSHMGIPMAPYHFWYLWSGPHHNWNDWDNNSHWNGGGGSSGGGSSGGGSSSGGSHGGFGGFGGGGFGGGHGGFGGGGGGFSGGGGGRR